MKMEKAALICKKKRGDWNCPNVFSGDNKQQLCDKHFEQHKEFLARNPSVVSEEKRRLFGIDKEIQKKKEKDLPPDELRCCLTGGNLWRCKNVRMGFDAAEDDNSSNVPKSRYCRHHYTYNVERQKNKGKKKKRSEGGAAKRKKEEKEIEKKKGKEKKEKELPPNGQHCCKTSGRDLRSKNVRMSVDAAEDISNVDRRANKKKRSGDGEAEAEGAGAGCTTNYSNKRRKKVVSEDDPFLDETGIQPDTTSDTSDSDSTFIANIGTKRNEVMEDGLSVDDTRIQPATSNTTDKSIEGGSANIGTKRKTVERTECSGELESLTINKDPVVQLESLEHYKSECVRLAMELEKKKAECTTLQGKLVELDTRMTTVTEESKRALADATECCRQMQSDLESRLLRMEKEKSTMGYLESRILNLENIVLRMDNLNSPMAGSVESRLSKLESLNLRSRDNEMKWNSETDMLSSFEEDPELCMKAVCALYRLLISEDETSAKNKQLFIPSDTLRVTTLAKFLMGGDCNGDLKKSVEDLEIFDSEGIKDCKKLARRYSDPLFSVYQNGEDPYFLQPTTASSHGYQTSK